MDPLVSRIMMLILRNCDFPRYAIKLVAIAAFAGLPRLAHSAPFSMLASINVGVTTEVSVL